MRGQAGRAGTVLALQVRWRQALSGMMRVVPVLRLVSLHLRQRLVEKVPASVNARIRRIRGRVQNEDGRRIGQVRQGILIPAQGSIQDVKRRVRYDHLLS